MVHTRKPLPTQADQAIDIREWLSALPFDKADRALIEQVYHFALIASEGHVTSLGLSPVSQDLEVAHILSTLDFDAESLAAALLYHTFAVTDLTLDDIRETIRPTVAALIQHVAQLERMNLLEQKIDVQNAEQIERMRQLFLTMVKDVRAVVIKLAEQIVILKHLRDQPAEKQRLVAKETLSIFAPLANRLGLHTLKWELEDLAFSYQNPKSYKEIARFLEERRVDRTKRVEKFVEQVQQLLKKNHVTAEVYGRAKHIYSIKRKMQQKNLTLSKIYDIHAIRILTNNLKDCYRALSLIHEKFEPIQSEFDDYIAKPKPNGYQSIHTAVKDSDHKNFEIQIRTQKMHQYAEQGVAAHWMYKEGKKASSAYEEKINWLRHVLDWQKELTEKRDLPPELEKHILEDRIYVFTPTNDIIDLPVGATPLDFAYHVHTDVGHRCRGAKIKDKIVPLTHLLKTGDQVEILTTKTGCPSRDWLIEKRGYLKTSTARAKVLQWFKRQDQTKNIAEGRTLLERECERLGITDLPNLTSIAHELDFKSADLMLAALGNGSLRLTQILQKVASEALPIQRKTISIAPSKTKKSKDQIHIQGIGHLLYRFAQCCKPLPGDPVIGYITQNQGVTIHHAQCKNIIQAQKNHQNRLLEASWANKAEKNFPIDIEIIAYDRPGLIRDITNVLSIQKINILSLTSQMDRKNQQAHIILTIMVNHLEILGKILDHIALIPNVYKVKRRLVVSG